MALDSGPKTMFCHVTFLVIGSVCLLADASFFAVNHGAVEFIIGSPNRLQHVAAAGGFFEEANQEAIIEGGKVRFVPSQGPEKHLSLASGTAGRHVGLVVEGGGKTPLAVDANDLQVALSEAASLCKDEDYACIAKGTFGGVPEDFTKRMFQSLWISWEYWHQCDMAEPSPTIRTGQIKSGKTMKVLREEPLVATVHSFVTEEECRQLLKRARVKDLTQAHVGGTEGSTTTSMARETLTTNMFVDWGKQDTLSKLAARIFDFASELLGEEVPYEGQEPLNFLHYLKGFEYRPHPDGMSGRRRPVPKGKRVATTLVYCEAPAVGGATVFPQGQKLKFAPAQGDILFFGYSPDPQSDAIHAACPVLKGNKTVLTQWHRLGVSIENPWDNFETWGKFHNPYGQTRWHGPRYGDRSEL